jgi:hypothetical protein
MAADQVLTAEDYMAIQRLAHEFNRAFDAGDADAFNALFAPGGVLERDSGGGNTAEERGALVTRSLGRPAHRHFTTNVIVDVVADDPLKVNVLSNWLYCEARGESMHVHGTGTYSDVLVKSADRWLIEMRVAKRDDVPTVSP